MISKNKFLQLLSGSSSKILKYTDQDLPLLPAYDYRPMQGDQGWCFVFLLVCTGYQPTPKTICVFLQAILSSQIEMALKSVTGVSDICFQVLICHFMMMPF